MAIADVNLLWVQTLQKGLVSCRVKNRPSRLSVHLLTTTTTTSSSGFLLFLCNDDRFHVWKWGLFRKVDRWLIFNPKRAEGNHRAGAQNQLCVLEKVWMDDKNHLLMYLTLWWQTHSHFDRTGSGCAAHFTASFWVRTCRVVKKDCGPVMELIYTKSICILESGLNPSAPSILHGFVKNVLSVKSIILAVPKNLHCHVYFEPNLIHLPAKSQHDA